VSRYGRTDTVTLADTVCLWYGVYRSRTIRVILLRDRGATTGYGLALITTDLHTPAGNEIITRYAARWSIEVAFADAKQITGVGEARNRTPRRRTHRPDRADHPKPHHRLAHPPRHRRHHQPPHRSTLVPHKTRPAYHDMIVQLRHVMIAAKILDPPRPANPQQIRAVILAWEQAAA
jgi:hypothetical protein